VIHAGDPRAVFAVCITPRLLAAMTMASHCVGAGAASAVTRRRNMLRADRRVVVSHVGSLVRPPAMIPYLEKMRDKEPYDEAAFE